MELPSSIQKVITKAKSNPYSNATVIGVTRAIDTIFRIAKILIPVYFIIKVLQHSGALLHIAAFFEPVMFIFGLKGDTALAIILSNALNIYAGLAIIANLEMTTKEITTLAMMILFSHSLPIETAVLKNIGVSKVLQITIRICVSIITGIVMNLVWGLFA